MLARETYFRYTVLLMFLLLLLLVVVELWYTSWSKYYSPGPHSEVTRPCARGDTSPSSVFGLPKSASPCALCNHCHYCCIACLASSPSPLAPLHLHLHLSRDPEVTLHHLT